MELCHEICFVVIDRFGSGSADLGRGAWVPCDEVTVDVIDMIIQAGVLGNVLGHIPAGS